MALPVAFIGLGELGSPMATNLLAKGFALTVHNRHREREWPLAAAGARRALTPAEAAKDAAVLALCLSDDTAVAEVLLGRGCCRRRCPGGPAPRIPGDRFLHHRAGVLPRGGCRFGRAWRGLSRCARDRWHRGARAGTLSVLVGGEASDLARARPVLEAVGRTVTHLGPVGAGQEAKAVNQVLVAGGYAAVAEALALGQRLGLPMEAVRQALLGGAAGSWALEHRGGSMLRGEFPLGFRLRLHRKDLAIALEAATTGGLELPVARQVAAMEDDLIAAGHGDEDVSALARWFMEPF